MRAQAPAPAPLAVPNPTYIAIPLGNHGETVPLRRRENASASIAISASICGCPAPSSRGKDGEFGAVRSIGNEVLVGKTELSYTYTQPVREGRPYSLYPGTLEARPVTATTSKLIYTLILDNSFSLADDAARDRG